MPHAQKEVGTPRQDLGAPLVVLQQHDRFSYGCRGKILKIFQRQPPYRHAWTEVLIAFPRRGEGVGSRGAQP